MSEDEKTDGRLLLDGRQMAEMSNALWNRLNLIVALNNWFLEELQGLGPFDHHQERAIERWSRDVAKAHAGVIEAARAMNAKPEGTTTN